MTPAQRRATYRKKQRWQYPYRYEKQVASRMRNFFDRYADITIKFIEARYPRKSVKVVYPRNEVRTDDFGTEWELFLEDLRGEFESGSIKTGISVDLSPFLKRISTFVLTFNEDEVSEYFKGLTGSAFYGTTEWWDDMQTQWLAEAAVRAEGTILDYFEDIRKTVLSSVRNNTPFEELVSIIQRKNSSLSRSKAEFLARDLTGKLNGTIEQKLQQSLGIDTYLWQTAGDEKVRGRPGGRYPDAVPSHWDMDSLLCSWSDPSVYSFNYGYTWVPRTAKMPIYHPGMDWRCRCLGTPFSIAILRAIDAELARE
jgi:hypothetical protein